MPSVKRELDTGNMNSYKITVEDGMFIFSIVQMQMPLFRFYMNSLSNNEGTHDLSYFGQTQRFITKFKMMWLLCQKFISALSQSA